MKKTMSKLMITALLSCVTLSVAHAEDENSSKAEIKKQVQVCAKKKQGDWVTYASKGVTYNGACLPNENGKLQFSFPAPASSGATTSTPDSAVGIEHRPAVEPAPSVSTEPAGVPSEVPQVTQPANTESPNPTEPTTNTPVPAQ